MGKEVLQQLTVSSTFDYEANQLDSKVVAIFDKNFNQINTTIIDEENWLVLDKTCIYALSGGQEPDKGYILFNNEQYNIFDAIKAPNGQHLHKVRPTKQISVGDNIKVVCDQQAKQIISANHTAEHIVQGALRKILDPNLKQMGVSLTHDYLTVSFAYDNKLTEQQLKQVEDFVNKAISNSYDIEIYHKTLDEAVTMGAVAKFDEVYSKVKGLLRIVKISDIYTVLCAGRHVHNTKELEEFHITKFSSKGSNVWKIEAIATTYLANKYIEETNKYVQDKIQLINNQIKESGFDNVDFINQLNNIKPSNVWDQSTANKKTIDKLSIEFNKQLDAFKNKQLNNLVKQLVEETKPDLSKPYTLIQLNNKPSNILNILGSQLINKYPNTGFVLINVIDPKISYALIKSPNANILKPSELIKQINQIVNGRGGGKDNQSQGSCQYTQENVDKIINLINTLK